MLHITELEYLQSTVLSQYMYVWAIPDRRIKNYNEFAEAF